MRMKISRTFLALSFLSLVAAAQTTLNVPSATHPTIQSAIVAAVNGNTVLVQPGTYIENIDFLGKAITVVSALGRTATTIQRAAANSTTVRFHTAETSSSVLDGFTIRQGNPGNVSCEGASPTIRNCDIVAGLPTIVGAPLNFKSGGVTCNMGASPQFINCLIAGNGVANSDAAGGVLLIGGGATFTNCTIQGNVSGGVGGVQCSFSGNPLVTPSFIDCTITNNQGGSIGFQSQGGAGGVNLLVSALLRRCSITNNFGGPDFFGGGGGVNINGASPTIEFCRISNNQGASGFQAGAFFTSQPGNGGGINIVGSGTPIIRNCLIFANTGGAGAPGPISTNPPPPPMPWITNGGAGGIEVHGTSTPRIVNCTIFGNFGGAAGGTGTVGAAGGLNVNGVTGGPNPVPNVQNTIIWGNTAPTGIAAGIQVIGGTAITVQRSDVQGGFAGSGNINSDPFFAGSAIGDFHLLPASPCINAGSNTTPNVPTVDLDGDARPFYYTVDMGVDEYLDPCITGVVGVGQGGPFDVFTINGSAARQQTLAIFAPIVLDVLQPVTNPFPAAFALVAYVGPFGPLSATNLGAGGVICFPASGPNFLVVASTFGLPAVPLIFATQAPWTLPYLAGFPYAIDIALQGVIEEAPGTFKVTNGVILRII